MAIETAENSARITRVVQLVSLATEVGEAVKLRGNRGPCPFAEHNSKDSFGIFKTPTGTWLWNCFACGESGNVISFLAKLGDMPFLEALEALESKYGLGSRDDSLERLKSLQSREKALKHDFEKRRRLELLDIREGLLRIESRIAEVGDFYHQLLSLDEAEELSRLVDQKMILLARYDELFGLPVEWSDELD